MSIIRPHEAVHVTTALCFSNKYEPEAEDVSSVSHVRSLQRPCFSQMCGDNNTNTHSSGVLLTQWYDNLCADFETHTQLCNGVKFYDSTQNFANPALWFAAKLPFTPPPPSTLWARSLAFTSSHLSAFYQPLLPLPAPYFFHPIHPTTMLFILSFLSLLASLFSPSPTSIRPPVSAFLFKYFTFIIFYFFLPVFSFSCPPLSP